MDGGATIKQEPLDDVEVEYSSECAFFDHVKVECEDDLTEMCTEPTKSDNLGILAEKPNLITVHATESIKIENELFCFEQALSEGDHAYAKLNNNRKVLRKPKRHIPVESNNLVYECKKNCGKKFSTMVESALHEAHEHKEISRVIKCNFCNKNFNSFFALTRHMPEHRNVQRFVCTHCSKCCTSYKDLQIHWKTSTDCYKGESFPPNTIHPNNLDENKIPTPKLLQFPSYTKSNDQPFRHQEVTLSVQQKSASTNNEGPFKTQSFLTLIPPVPPTQQALSFAEEIKEFAAKYQLKSSLVAKKRTSPLVINPINGKHKKSKKFDNGKFETVSEYAVPKAIGPSNCSVDHPLTNMTIKEEPLDHYDGNVTTEYNCGVDNKQVIISEPLNDYFEVKNEPFDDPIEDMNLGTFGINSDFIQMEDKPTTCFSTTLNNPSSVNEPVSKKNLERIKPDIEQNKNHSETFLLVKTKCNGRENNTDTMPYKNIKILKLAPNAKIIKLPSLKVKSSTHLNGGTASLKPAVVIGSTPNKNYSVMPPLQPIKLSLVKKTEVSLTKEEEVKEDHMPFTKILEKAISNGQPNKRINSVPKAVLRFIEQQPQKIKIMEDIQRQIEMAKNISESSLKSKNSTENEKSIGDESVEKDRNEIIEESKLDLPPPTAFFLSVTNQQHTELNTARRTYRNFRFSWVCPRCPKLYDQKHAFLGHLVSCHNMCREEFEKLIVEVRPFPIDKSAKKQKRKNIHELLSKKVAKLPSDKQKEDWQKVRFLTNSQLRCPKCNRFCSSRTMLNDHVAGDCSRVPLYKCTECSKSFYSASTLTCHMSIHTGELPHKCNFCDKRFRTRGQVTVHHRTHTGEKPFQCQVCSQRFTHRETLISHLSRHIGMKRYRCYACGKHFSCVSGLKAHHEQRPDTCGLVKLNTRAVGPRVRVVRGQVHFEPQPEINAYLRTEDPPEILSEIQNIQQAKSEE